MEKILNVSSVATASDGNKTKEVKEMNVSKILRPDELPFDCPPDLELAINELIAALERDERLNLDCYLDEVQGSARSVSEENDRWICDYYVYGGWKRG